MTYQIPSMAQINATPYNGFNVVSFFSGCGGSSLGYRMAGYKVHWANEFIPAARETYQANFPATIVDDRDIRGIQPAEVLTTVGLQPGELDILDGSPPCCAFSSCGRREKNWAKINHYSEGVKQRTDDLFLEYIRMIEGLQPKVFIAENVKGLTLGAAKTKLDEFLTLMRQAGYNVDYRLLNAAHYGVPQSRIRLFIIGVRNDLGLDPVFPAPLDYTVSLRDALTGVDPFLEPETDIARFAIGREYDNFTRQSERYFNLFKPCLDKPCNTITANAAKPSAASVVHPTEKRKFSVAELKRICAFPDDFILTGTYQQQAERIGRAVPPLLTFNIARAIKENILCKIQ